MNPQSMKKRTTRATNAKTSTTMQDKQERSKEHKTTMQNKSTSLLYIMENSSAIPTNTQSANHMGPKANTRPNGNKNKENMKTKNSEYRDRIILHGGNETSFREYKIQIHRTKRPIRRIIDGARRRNNMIKVKLYAHYLITKQLQKWQTRQLDHDAEILHEAAGKNDMNPIWKYQKNIAKTKQDRHYTLTKTDGTQTKTLPGRMARWAE